MDILSLDTPAWTNRSMTFASTPQVMGLMKPSGGGGMNEVLILSNCETKVGSPGIQFPMTMRRAGSRHRRGFWRYRFRLLPRQDGPREARWCHRRSRGPRHAAAVLAPEIWQTLLRIDA